MTARAKYRNWPGLQGLHSPLRAGVGDFMVKRQGLRQAARHAIGNFGTRVPQSAFRILGEGVRRNVNYFRL